MNITIPGLEHNQTILTHAWVPHARGVVQSPPQSAPGQDVEAVAVWDDGSIRVEHIWAEWTLGVTGPEPMFQPAGGAFPDVSWVGPAPVVAEMRGQATCKHVGLVLRDTPFRRVTYFEGPLNQPGLPPYAYRRTWVTSFAGHKTLLIDHSLTWIRPMRDYRVGLVDFAGVIQWCTSVADLPATWADRIQWDGAKSLGEPITIHEIKSLTAGIPDIEFQENRREHYLYTDLHGTTIRDRWQCTPGEEIRPWPLPGHCDPATIEASGVLGPVSCGMRDAADGHSVMMAKAFHSRATPGRFTKNNPPRKWVEKEGRPSAHRPGIGSYYCWGETLWLEAARLGSQALYELAQGMTDHTVQFGQCAEWANPPDKWHRPGMFWKNGEPVGSPPGMPETQEWTSWFGRSPDPMGLHHAWVFGGDQRAKWGFDLWATNASFASFAGGRNREGAKTIGMVADVCEWLPGLRPAWKPYLSKLVAHQLGTPGYTQTPNALWDPLWIQKALPHLDGLQSIALRSWAQDWRDAMRRDGVTKNQDTEAMSLSVLDGRPNVLREHLPKIAHKIYTVDGGPGPLGDDFIMRQWGAYRYALEKAGAAIDLRRSWPTRIPVANVSFGDVATVGRRGTRFLAHAKGGLLSFTLHGCSIGGDPAPCTWVVTDSAGKRLASGEWRHIKLGPRIPATLGYSGTFDVSLPDGPYYVCIGGHALELLPPPEAIACTLPAGTYFVRAPNRWVLSGPPDATVTVTSESADSRLGVADEDGSYTMLSSATYEKVVHPITRPLEIIGGVQSQGRLVLSADCVLL